MSRCKHWSQEDITTPLLQQHILPTFNLLLSSHSPRHWIGHPVWARHHMSRSEHWSEENFKYRFSSVFFQPSTFCSQVTHRDTGLGTQCGRGTTRADANTGARTIRHTQLHQHASSASNLQLSTHSPRQLDWAPSCGRGILVEAYRRREATHH